MKNLIIIFTVLFGLFITQDINAKNDKKKSEVSQTSTLSGKVVDKITGEPLVGVKIKITELGIVTYTDFEGNFSFTNVQKGNYNIATDYISYENSVLKDVYLEKQNNTVKIELHSN